MAPGVGEPAHLCSAVPTGVMAPGAGDPIILEFAVVFHSSPGFGAKLSSVVRYTRRGRRHDGGSQARLLGAGCAAARDGQDRGGLVSSAPTAPPLLGVLPPRPIRPIESIATRLREPHKRTMAANAVEAIANAHVQVNAVEELLQSSKSWQVAWDNGDEKTKSKIKMILNWHKSVCLVSEIMALLILR